MTAPAAEASAGLKQRALLLLAAVTVLALAACQAPEARPRTGTNGGQSPNVVVEVAEWSVRPNPGAVRAGELAFGIRNLGPTQEHELVVLRSNLPADELLMEAGVSQVDEEASGRVEGYVAAHRLPPNGSTTTTFTLAPGQYVLFCNVPGHYQAGMYGNLTVSEPRADP